MKMLRSQSDFIVSDVLVDSSPQAPPGSAPLAAAATGSSSSGPGSSNGDDPRASAGSAAAAWVDASRRARPGCWCCPAPISAAFARLNGTLTFVPGFIVPWGSGQLAPGQVATIVKEAFARYPDRGITNWALEYARCVAGSWGVHVMCYAAVVTTGLQAVALCLRMLSFGHLSC